MQSVLLFDGKEMATLCYTDVSNTALILAAQLLNMNQLLCPVWVSERHSTTFSTVRERESHPQRQFSVCSRLTNHERIINESQRECESRPVLYVSHGSSTPRRHACGWVQLNWERNESVHEVDSIHFVHSKDLFVRTTRSQLTHSRPTRSRPTQH